MTKPRPKTGEKRVTQQPLKIDRLPVEVRDRIQALRDLGRTWPEIEELSKLAYNAKWMLGKGGFVDWDALPAPVLKLFPIRKLPHTSLLRWFDLRVRQVAAETMARSAQARELAAAFAASVVEGGDEAVLNAARDQLMGLLAEDAGAKNRFTVAKGLIQLAKQMQGARTVDIKERQVGVDERKLAALEQDLAMKRAKFEKETNAAADKARRGQKLTEADINSIRSSVFGLGPVAAKPGP